MSEADLPVGRLRALATDHIREGRSAELVVLEPARADTEYWRGWWMATRCGALMPQPLVYTVN